MPLSAVFEEEEEKLTMDVPAEDSIRPDRPQLVKSSEINARPFKFSDSEPSKQAGHIPDVKAFLKAQEDDKNPPTKAGFLSTVKA